MSDFPRRLRLLCQRAGIKPTHLAARLKVNKSAVSRWMHADGRPRIPVEQIAIELGMTIAEFYAVDLDRVERGLARRKRKGAAA